MLANEDEQCLWERIVKAIENHKEDFAKESSRLKLVSSIKEDEFEEAFSYNEMLEFIEQQENDTIEWKFKRIAAHRESLKPNYSNYNESIYNVMIE